MSAAGLAMATGPRSGLAAVPLWVVAACVLASAWCLAFGIDTGPLPEVGRYRDDAYYYFEWARNVAAGRGPTVSAGVDTSGVHALWAGLLAAASGLGADLEVWAQRLGLALHALTAVAMAWSAAAAGRRFGLAVGALYLGQPFLLREAQNGQETALACALLVALWLCRRRGALTVGAVSALAVLARSDLAFAVVGLAVHRAWTARAWGWLLVPAAALVPYALVNLALAGHPLQDSAAPVPWLMNANFAATDPTAGEWGRRLWWLFRPCLLGWPWTLGSVLVPALWLVAAWPRAVASAGRYLPLLAVAMAALLGFAETAPWWIAACAVCLEPLAHRRRREGLLSLWLVAFGALVFVHFVVRAYPRAYYFAPLLAAGTIASWRLARQWPVILALLAVESVAFGLAPRSTMDWQEEMAMAGRFVDRFVPTDEVVGCFNSGLVTWHRKGPVANLDGVVDRRAFEALRRGQQLEHWRALGIRWVVDNPAQFSRDPGLLHASGRWLAPDFDRDRDLVEVARFAAPGGNALRPETEDFRLYFWTDGGQNALPERAASPALVDLGPAPDGGRYLLWRGGASGSLWLETEPRGARVALAAAVPGVAQVLKVPPWEGRCRIIDPNGASTLDLSR